MKFIFAAVLMMASAANAQNDFRPLVREALQKGERRVVIPPGVYRLAPAAGQGVIWTLQGVRDTTIVADGVTLIGTKLTRALHLDHCRNVTLQGLTVDYDPLPFTQGSVVAVADDKSWIDVKIHDGYPRKPLRRLPGLVRRNEGECFVPTSDRILWFSALEPRWAFWQQMATPEC